MERAGRILTGLKSTASSVPAEALACKVWETAVGKKILAHAKAVRLADRTLIVEVEDAVWQRQLSTLKPHIVRKIGELVGRAMVSDVEFRVAVPRRMPDRAERHDHARTPLFDEADGIHDPVLRRLYIISRKRASA
jgi:hypothetical protein